MKGYWVSVTISDMLPYENTEVNGEEEAIEKAMLQLSREIQEAVKIAKDKNDLINIKRYMEGMEEVNVTYSPLI